MTTLNNETPDLNNELDPAVVAEMESGFDSLDGEHPEPAPIVPEVTPESNEPSPEDDEEIQEPKPEQKGQDLSLNAPSKYEGESETQYQLRTELWRAGRAKASADTEEEKSLITQHMKELRKEMGSEAIKAKARAAQRVETTDNQADPSGDTSDSLESDSSEEEAARVALEKLGYLDKAGVEKMLKQALQTQQNEVAAKEHGTAVSDFYKTRPDIAIDSNRRDMLENYVLENFKITPSTTKKQLVVSLDMAASYLFPKTSRTANASQAEAKRTIVSGSSNTKQPSTVDESTAKAMREAGYSEDDIRSSGW